MTSRAGSTEDMPRVAVPDERSASRAGLTEDVPRVAPDPPRPPVEISTTGAFKAGTPRTLFEGRYVRSPNAVAGYDVGPDGRFLMVQPLHPDPPTNQIHVVLNWTEELKRGVPTN